MSTKLYNFYKINDTYENVHDKIKLLREEIYSDIGLQYQVYFAHYLAGLVDKTFSKQFKLNKQHSYENILKDILEEHYEKNKTSNFGLFDFFENSLIVCVYQKEIYIKTFLLEKPLAMFLKLFDKCEDFHYQNSTDKPDDISDEDWNNRSVLVNELFGSGPMSHAGLVAEFRPELFSVKWDFHKKEEIIKQIPNKRIRALKIANQKIEKEYYEDNGDSKEIFWEFVEYKKSSEYQILLDSTIYDIWEEIKTINIEDFDFIEEES